MRSSNHDRTSGFRGGGNNLQPSGYISNNSGGGYRGNRGGGYNNRGGGMNATSSYNRGYQQPMTGGFQGPPMNGFQGMGGAQSFGGFQNRGGMMGSMRGGSVGIRGGRGGMNGNGMMAMPMGGMGMGNMGTQMGGLGMGMPQMAAGMGMQGMQSFQNPLPSTRPGQYSYASASNAPTTCNVYSNGSPDTSGSWANCSGYTQFPASGNASDSPSDRVNASSIAAIPSPNSTKQCANTNDFRSGRVPRKSSTLQPCFLLPAAARTAWRSCGRSRRELESSWCKAYEAG